MGRYLLGDPVDLRWRLKALASVPSAFLNGRLLPEKKMTGNEIHGNAQLPLSPRIDVRHESVFPV